MQCNTRQTKYFSFRDISFILTKCIELKFNYTHNCTTNTPESWILASSLEYQNCIIQEALLNGTNRLFKLESQLTES